MQAEKNTTLNAELEELCLQFTTSQGQCEELAGQLGLLEQWEADLLEARHIAEDTHAKELGENLVIAIDKSWSLSDHLTALDNFEMVNITFLMWWLLFADGVGV